MGVISLGINGSHTDIMYT